MDKNVMKNVMKKTNEVEIEEVEISKDEKLSWARMAGVWGVGADIQISNWWLRGHLGDHRSQPQPFLACCHRW